MCPVSVDQPSTAVRTNFRPFLLQNCFRLLIFLGFLAFWLSHYKTKPFFDLNYSFAYFTHLLGSLPCYTIQFLLCAWWQLIPLTTPIYYPQSNAVKLNHTNSKQIELQYCYAVTPSHGKPHTGTVQPDSNKAYNSLNIQTRFIITPDLPAEGDRVSTHRDRATLKLFQVPCTGTHERPTYKIVNFSRDVHFIVVQI